MSMYYMNMICYMYDDVYDGIKEIREREIEQTLTTVKKTVCCSRTCHISRINCVQIEMYVSMSTFWNANIP